MSDEISSAPNPIVSSRDLHTAQTLMALGRDREALGLLQGDPGPGVGPDLLLAQRSIARWNAGDINGAVEELRSARSTGDFPLADHALAWMLLQLQLPREALAPARAATRARTDDPKAHALLAVVQLGIGDGRAAQQSAAELMRFPPHSTKRFELVGHAALSQGRWALAEQHFAEALRLEPDSYEALVGRGVALERLGRRAEAMTSLVDALGVDADGIPARIRLKRIVEPYLLSSMIVVAVCMLSAVVAGALGIALGIVPLGLIGLGLAPASAGAVMWHRRRARTIPEPARPMARSTVLSISNLRIVWARWNGLVLLMAGVAFIVVAALTGLFLVLGLLFAGIGIRRLLGRSAGQRRGVPPLYESLLDT
ncbi:MAG: tetratricopeptide repeat protein [Actinomycetota bacterium]